MISKYLPSGKRIVEVYREKIPFIFLKNFPLSSKLFPL